MYSWLCKKIVFMFICIIGFINMEKDFIFNRMSDEGCYCQITLPCWLTFRSHVLHSSEVFFYQAGRCGDVIPVDDYFAIHPTGLNVLKLTFWWAPSTSIIKHTHYRRTYYIVHYYFTSEVHFRRTFKLLSYPLYWHQCMLIVPHRIMPTDCLQISNN